MKCTFSMFASIIPGLCVSRLNNNVFLASLSLRLVMYIERDIRKATPGKEQQSGNEYLSKCLALFIRHTVRELPAILGKSITLHPKRERKTEGEVG